MGSAGLFSTALLQLPRPAMFIHMTIAGSFITRFLLQVQAIHDQLKPPSNLGRRLKSEA
jgi:hypothetical protein